MLPDRWSLISGLFLLITERRLPITFSQAPLDTLDIIYDMLLKRARRRAMDYLWTPWRFQYMKDAAAGKQPECIFCDAVQKNEDEVTLIVYRGKKAFVILNRFPYTSGHVMIVPYAHVAELNLVEAEALQEMMRLAQRVETIFRAEYTPDGMNLGMNLGRAAGAGVTGHLHLHMLPRWIGDANFMTVTGETRVHPEELRTTYEKLKMRFVG